MRTRITTTVAVLLGVALSPLVTPAPAAAAQAGGPRLALAGIPAWTPLGGTLDLDLQIDDPTATLEVRVALGPPLTSRTAFERALAGPPPRSTIGSVSTSVGALSPGGRGSHRVSVLLGEPPPPPEPPEPSTDGTAVSPPPPPLSIPPAGEGVYPVIVELREPDDDEVAERLVTYAVVVDPAAERAPLNVAWVWPVIVDGPRRPDGTPSTGLQEAIAAEGRLAQMTAALASLPDVPVTLAPQPATLDAWSELAATAPEGSATPGGFSAFRDQAARRSRQVVTGTYARVDLPALTRSGLEEEITAQLTEGADVLRSTLGVRPDPRTFLTGGTLDDGSLTTLRQAGVDRVVLPRQAVVAVEEKLTPARPFTIESNRRTFHAATPDPALSALLSPEAGDGEDARLPSDVEAAQRLLAGLAVVAFEAPSEERGVVVSPSPAWNPRAGMLTAVLAGLTDHPSLEPVLLDTLFARVAPREGDSGRRALADAEPARLALTAAAVRNARDRISSLAGMVPEDAGQPLLASRRLLLAEAQTFQRRGADPSASDYLAGVDAIINSVLATVRLPSKPSVTLTAERGRVPLTLVNDSGVPLDVRLHFTSEQLLFPDGDTRALTLPPRSTTEAVTVETRTPGRFPMLVEVTSPDGRLLVGSFEMTIRSTAVSGVALAVTVGAGVFLMGWWGNHIRRTRRRRRLEEAEDALDDPSPRGPAWPA